MPACAIRGIVADQPTFGNLFLPATSNFHYEHCRYGRQLANGMADAGLSLSREIVFTGLYRFRLADLYALWLIYCMLTIRRMMAADVEGACGTLKAAYKRDTESRLLTALRNEVEGTLGFVAIEDDVVLGVAMFVPVNIAGDTSAMALGPVAVRPDCQGKGIGSKLLRKGLMELRFTDCPLVVVVGASKFFVRFGFRPAARLGLRCMWDIPEESFVAVSLDPVRARDFNGLVRYPEAFHVDEA